MGTTLNLVNQLLSDVRRFLEFNQPRQALRLIRSLASVANQPGSTAAEIDQLAGETYLSLGQLRLARRHLRRSIRRDPQNAQAHYDLARAIECDPATDASRAARHYLRAIELAPHSLCLLCDAGSYFVQTGRMRKGLSLIAKAVELAPEDAETLQLYVESLCEANRFAEAQRAINVARFSVRSEAVLGRLRENVEYRQARETQQSQTCGKDAAKAVVLPYLRIVSDQPLTVRGAKYRRDQASKSRPHLPSRFTRFDTGRSG
jgi:Tfp pilus assembly protein PilF